MLVDYVCGDIDKPVVVAQMHNPNDPPPWPVDESVNHAGVLSGLQTHSHDGPADGVNQWVTDDSTGQLRARLGSGTAQGWSELSLGHLIQQGPQGSHSNRGAWLGSGFYGHTDGWAVVRSHEGLLLSTSTRSGTYGSAASTQMDAAEAVQQTLAAQNLGKRLNAALTGQGAASLMSHEEDPSRPLQKLMQDVDPAEQGRFNGPVGGQRCGAPVGGGSSADRTAKVITLDSNLQSDPKGFPATFAHEVGHAKYPGPSHEAKVI